jgi:Mrp family chromosome partitioning ATPase
VKAAAARRRFEDNIESLRLSVSAAAQAAGGRVTALIGHAPGVGTTTLALALARSLARQSGPTLLVDGNFVNPVLHDVFHLDPEAGAGDLVERRAESQQAVRPTSESNLSVLPCGKHLGSINMSVEQWHNYWRGLSPDRFIVIDAGSADSPGAMTLANACDGVILVVKCGAARREQIESIEKSLSLSGTRLLGLVLNQRRYVVPDAIYRRL